MGTATGHMVPGILLLSTGLWHLLCGLRNQVKYPREYSARSWQAVEGFSGRLRYLELYALVALLPLAVLFELTVSTHFQPWVDGIIPGNRVNTFQHSTMLFTFWLWALVTLVSESTSLLPLPGGASFLLAAVAFGVEMLVLSSEVAQISVREVQVSGLESRCYWLLGCITGVCAGSALVLAWQPKAFLADLLLSAGLVLQGTWSIQIGLSLYVDAFIPAGCGRLDHLPSGVDASTQCDLPDSAVRAMALMDLAFNCHVIAVVLLSVLAYGLLARLQADRRAYQPVSSNFDLPDQVQMKPLPKMAQF